MIASLPAPSATSQSVRQPQWRPGYAPTGSAVSSQRAWPVTWVVGFLLLHLGLAVLMKQIRLIAGLHALATVTFGLVLCFTRTHPLKLAQWVAYTVGAEVLWRMCKAPVPWEIAKHAIWVTCLISLFRSNGFRSSWLPALFFVLLVPGGLVTFVRLPLDEARQEVSFYMAGPLCLAVCALWFSSRKLTVRDFQRLGLALLAPVAGVAFVALFKLATADVEFSNASSFSGSGGYGPNQVSAMLGLGAVVAVLLYLGEKRSSLLRGCFAALALWLLAQSALTFSRTGLYLFGASFGAAAVFLIQRRGGARRFLFVVLILGAGACAVLPMLDAFTGGKLGERFSDKGLTGRDTIAKLDLQVWRDRPVFGAGAGVSVYYRAEIGDAHAAHTEYTRLLADHGLLGAGALIILLAMTLQAFLRARGPWAKAIVSALATWAFLFMTVSAMRLAAPAFLLGLIHARFLTDPAVGRRVLRAGFRNSRVSLPLLPRTRRLGGGGPY